MYVVRAALLFFIALVPTALLTMYLRDRRMCPPDAPCTDWPNAGIVACCVTTVLAVVLALWERQK